MVRTYHDILRKQANNARRRTKPEMGTLVASTEFRGNVKSMQYQRCCRAHYLFTDVDKE